MCYELAHPSIGCLVAPENSILTESHKCHASTAYKIPFPTSFPVTTYNLKPTCLTTSQVHIRQSELELGTIHHRRTSAPSAPDLSRLVQDQQLLTPDQRVPFSNLSPRQSHVFRIIFRLGRPAARPVCPHHARPETPPLSRRSCRHAEQILHGPPRPRIGDRPLLP